VKLGCEDLNIDVEQPVTPTSAGVDKVEVPSGVVINTIILSAWSGINLRPEDVVTSAIDSVLIVFLVVDKPERV
jgi:hypothetical protein